MLSPKVPRHRFITHLQLPTKHQTFTIITYVVLVSVIISRCQLAIFVVDFSSVFSVQQHICRACYMLSLVHQSVAQVDQSKTVEVSIMQYSPYSPIPVVFEGQVSSRHADGLP